MEPVLQGSEDGGCAYCTFSAPPGTLMSVIRAHIENDCKFHPLRKQIKQIEAQLVLAYEALKKYGRHEAGICMNRSDIRLNSNEDFPCECGLLAALTTLTPPEGR